MRGLFLLSLFGLALNSCIPLPTEQGVCKTSEGDVNTYNIIGVWKRVPETTREVKNTSAGNYKLLMIAQGRAEVALEGDAFDDIDVYYNSLICEEIVSNNVRTDVSVKGLYFHDDARKRIKTNTVDLKADDPEPEEKLLTYTFSGNCNGTRLTLTDESGNSDTYTFVNNEVPADACGSKQ